MQIRILEINQNSWSKYETDIADCWYFLISPVEIVQNSCKLQSEFINNSSKKAAEFRLCKKGHWKRSCHNEPGKIGSRDFISKGSTSSSTPDNKSANCPRIFKSITSSLHVFTNPESTKFEYFFQWNLWFALICSTWIFI